MSRGAVSNCKRGRLKLNPLPQSGPKTERRRIMRSVEVEGNSSATLPSISTLIASSADFIVMLTDAPDSWTVNDD
jgi:hypothetical protein